MGKDKHAQRTKNNVRPSSSGRSAEMLGAAPLNPFMSFTSLKESMGVDDQLADSHLDPNFQVVLKKMNKKDGITKLKALQEFSQLCSTSEPDQVVAILPFWPRLYSLLALDVEHRVREAAHIAHFSVLSKVKRNIAPYLKQLVGPWFVAQCDTYAPAASAASVAFNETFPSKKMSEAIAFCQEEILNYIHENLIVHTPQSLSNAKTMTAEEIEAKYIRTIISSLQGYGLYLARLNIDQLQSAQELNRKLASDAKFWKFSNHASPQVRSAWFSALIALCQHAQFLLSGEEKRVGQAVFRSLDESDAAVLPVVWEAALVALVAIDGLLEAVSLEKLVLPKLLKVCREGGKGSAAAIFPSLLPLLSKMPANIAKDSNVFYNKFFSSIRLGFCQRNVQLSSSESRAVANAFGECLQYVIQLNHDNESLGIELLQQHMLPFVCNALVSKKQAHASDALYSSVSKLLHSWGRCTEGSLQRKLLITFCSDLSSALQNMAVGNETVGGCPDADKENLDVETKMLSEEATETEENKSTAMSKPVSKDVLKSQVDFIACLLQKKSRSTKAGKVKFADMKSQGAPEECYTEESRYASSEVTNTEIVSLGNALSCCYIKAATTMECVDYLAPLASLVKLLNSGSVYFDLAKAVSLSSEQELFLKLMINWLKPQNTLFCRAAVSLCVPLLDHTSTEEQTLLLDQLLEAGPDANQLLWIAEESVLGYKAALNWLRNDKLSPVLKAMTEEACSGKIDSTWELLSYGCSIASDGKHIFCHSALKSVLDVLVKNLEDMWHSSSTLPPWTSYAANALLKLYTEESPFLRNLSSPQEALSVVFQICLWKVDDSTCLEPLSKLWKNGSRALARMHGCTSAAILLLCSSFADASLTLLYKKLCCQKDDLMHIASQLAEFIEIVTDSFSTIDEDQLKRSTCSLLLTKLFSFSEGSAEGLRSVVAVHRNGLESLADSVEPFHPGIDSSQTVSKGSLAELIGAAYWGAIVGLVIHKLSSSSLFESQDHEIQEDKFFSWEIFLDIYVLSCDVRFIVFHFASTELSSLLHQLQKDTEDIILEITSAFTPIEAQKIHEILLERSMKIAAYKRAHKAWHKLPAKVSYDYFACTEPLVNITSSIDDESLKTLDLCPLDTLSEKLLQQGISEVIRPQAVFWLDSVHKLHIRCSGRLVSNETIGMCSVNVVHDTVRVMKFLRAVVSKSPELLRGSNWDQVMIAMASWLHCSHETVMELQLEHGNTSRLSIRICAFIQEVFKLFVTLNQSIIKLEEGSIELVDPERGSLKESFPREWNDVFAGECEHKILVMWTEIIENVKAAIQSPHIVALLDDLGHALQHSTTAFLQPSRDAAVVYEPLLKFAPPFLLHSLGSVRLAAFHLLFKIIPHMVERDAASLTDMSSTEESEGSSSQTISEDRLSLLRFEDVLLHAQTVVSTMLCDVRLGTSCTVQPFTDSYTYTSGYMFVWSLILEMCKTAETELKCQYAIWLKNASENYAETLLNNVFRLLPQEAFEEKIKKPLDYFASRPKMSFGDYWSCTLVEHLACDVLYGALSCLPALARQWWMNSEPKSATLIEKVVAKHLSPFLCSAEMAAVAKMQDKAVENMSVRVHSGVREVVATYTVDDLTMELVVRLPTNHPLTPMIVEVGKRNAAAAVQWRQWLMQLSMFLTHQNGSLWDGLARWRNNVVRRYEGVEECYICFCVLSGAKYQLPKLSCHTCRKKFHSTCLYKWFQTSNKSTCPICRNLF